MAIQERTAVNQRPDVAEVRPEVAEVRPNVAEVRPDMADAEAASTSELISRASDQIRTLAQAEFALARAEFSKKGKQAGIGGGLFAGAGALGFYLLGILLAAAVAGLAVVWPVWLAALVVAAAVALIAGVLALAGRARLRKATPLVPAEAVASFKQDIAAVRDAIAEGRRA